MVRIQVFHIITQVCVGLVGEEPSRFWPGLIIIIQLSATLARGRHACTVAVPLTEHITSSTMGNITGNIPESDSF